MKRTKMLIFYVIYILVALSTLGVETAIAQGMMGGRGGMMGGEGMREMMQNMMGDMLPPPMDPAQLPEPDSAGARLLQKYCSQCHHVPGPGLHTAKEWPAVMDRMNRRMQMMSRHGMMMGRVEAPTEGELGAILAYLQVHAQKPLDERLSPALESEAGQTFSGVCSRCHALPDPSQHPPREWPAVVERMKAYMVDMGRSVPDEKEFSEIVGFLQRHSGKQELSPKERNKP